LFGFCAGDGSGFGAASGERSASFSLVLVVIGDFDIGCFVGGCVGGGFVGGIDGGSTTCFVGGGPFIDSTSSSQSV